jgi:hypothetical protein
MTSEWPTTESDKHQLRVKLVLETGHDLAFMTTEEGLKGRKVIWRGGRCIPRIRYIHCICYNEFDFICTEFSRVFDIWTYMY